MEDGGAGSMMEYMVATTMAVGLSLAAWLVLPTALRRCHELVEEQKPSSHHVPFQQSVFGALEDPARLFAGAVTFSYLGWLVAPRSLETRYLAQIRTGLMVVSFVWFLYLYKRSMFTRLVAGKAREDRERLNTMDRLSTVALLVLGCMACAESCGVAVQSVLTVGGIGGVATAFAARDLLGNLLSGIGLQFSRPFSVGDYISAGDVSGQVVEIGLHSTEMLNGDKFPTVVPNSFFSSQVIINKSRVRQRGLDLNIPVKLSSLEKLPTITSEVRSMLHSCPRVLLDDDVEKPRCHVSQVGATSFNLAIFCNLKPMSWDEFLVAQEEVLLEASRIVVRSDPEEPDAEKSFSDGAEMVEKPVSSSPGSEDSLPEEKAQLTTPATVSVETTTDPSAALNNQAASWVSSSLPRRSPSMSRVGALVSDPKSSPRSSGRRQLVSAAATESPSTPRISNSMPASPRSRGHSGLLGVGSKLISRIKHSSKKH